MTRRYVIARHGNTFEADEPPRRIGSRTDVGLTSEGVRQAEALADAFFAEPLYPQRILCGPLRRSFDTAAIVADRLATATRPVAVEWLDEIDHGADENRTERDVIARIGEDALAAWDSHGVPPAGWRVGAPARLRAWQILFASTDAPTTLLVTSNGAARFSLLAARTFSDGRSLKLRTGAYGVIEVEGANWASLRAWDIRP